MDVKLKILRNKLLSQKLDGMIVSNPINVRYLTGLIEEGILLITPKENIFLTDSRYLENVNKKLTIEDEIVTYNIKDMTQYEYESIFNGCSSVGFEEKYVTYENYKRYLQQYRVELIETDGIVETQRVVKEDDEIECIQKACKITDDCFEHICNHIVEGMTEKEIAFEIEKYFVHHGADGLAFDTIVASGENSSVPHASPTDRKIQKGDIIQFDMGCKVNGYCSDFSRVIFVGEMKEEYKKIYDFVLDTHDRIALRYKDQVNIKPIIKDVETDYKLKGYEVLHSFGHGVGLEIHEIPIQRSTVDCMLKQNSVITVEPGVYIPGKFGIRIEDTYVVDKMGLNSLTKYSRDYKIVKLAKK